MKKNQNDTIKKKFAEPNVNYLYIYLIICQWYF